MTKIKGRTSFARTTEEFIFDRTARSTSCWSTAGVHTT